MIKYFVFIHGQYYDPCIYFHVWSSEINGLWNSKTVLKHKSLVMQNLFANVHQSSLATKAKVKFYFSQMGKTVKVTISKEYAIYKLHELYKLQTPWDTNKLYELPLSLPNWLRIPKPSSSIRFVFSARGTSLSKILPLLCSKLLQTWLSSYVLRTQLARTSKAMFTKLLSRPKGFVSKWTSNLSNCNTVLNQNPSN